MRTIHLLALLPIGLTILAISFWLLPPVFITPFNSWLLIEAALLLVFLVSHYTWRKYHLAREVPLIILGLCATLIIVLSYVTIEVQRAAFALTAIASFIMYYRLSIEFKRRKYT